MWKVEGFQNADPKDGAPISGDACIPRKSFSVGPFARCGMCSGAKGGCACIAFGAWLFACTGAGTKRAPAAILHIIFMFHSMCHSRPGRLLPTTLRPTTLQIVRGIFPAGTPKSTTPAES